MAEGFGCSLGAGILDVYSAGTAPAGVNPLAVQVMAEAGVDITDQTSDLIDGELLKSVDIVITLCGDARESCPFVPAKVEKRHWPLDDPTRAEGSEEDVVNEFRRVRDEIKQRVQDLLQEIKGS